ncbi:MAG: DUF1501 domain-containing protein, partial [Verrucomicrobia bacterium]|nr:DUF1501 domain-containing protein [Verrucomicrobiota bacterium]NDB77750.1 DUF1501 domain-containing protein [Verrucomicrobiota bacterium]NDD40644.1 DUF1501 domain-containing protein [Verrucomicrobiota bacterium]NDE96993.1 DUF1501 domain-containing protein [Verrucomicrobiota bacterium]
MTAHPPSTKVVPVLSRRALLRAGALGFGALATEAFLADAAGAVVSPFIAKPANFTPPAKSIIFLTQVGGPSQMDLFDPKPMLGKFDGQVHSERVEMFQKGSEANRILGSPWRFQPRGRCGMEISDALPHLASLADDLTLVRSMHGEHNNHGEALVLLSTGKIFLGRPSLGSWVSYALGTENQNLPAYVVLRDPEGYSTHGALLWQNGWLPAAHRGTEFSTRGAPVLHLQPTTPVPPATRQDQLELLAQLNRRHLAEFPGEPELEARLQNYELAARLQLTASSVFDLDAESAATRRLYGLDEPTTRGYGQRCLTARRLVEAGVRFVQVFTPIKPFNQPWDSHRNVDTEIADIAAMTDLPSAALITDLKARGLLDQTIVLWAGEFGRQPVSQNGMGRDHNRHAFSLLLAGGGFQPGRIHGATDD